MKTLRIMMVIGILGLALMLGLQAGMWVKDQLDGQQSAHPAGAMARRAGSPGEAVVTVKSLWLSQRSELKLGAIGLLDVPVKPNQVRADAQAEPSQLSILVVQTEDERLQAAWLLLAHSSRADHLVLIPIIQTSDAADSKNRTQLDPVFSLNSDGTLAASFLSEFNQYFDTQVGAYFLLDSADIAQLVDTIGGVQLVDNQLDGKASVEFVNANQVAGDALPRAICSRLGRLSIEINPIPLFGVLMNHLHLESLAMEDYPDMISMLLSKGRLNCDFPTLEQQMSLTP